MDGLDLGYVILLLEWLQVIFYYFGKLIIHLCIVREELVNMEDQITWEMWDGLYLVLLLKIGIQKLYFHGHWAEMGHL